MLENCVICKSESTPWFKVNGHICNDCYSLALESSNHYWRYVKDELPEPDSIVLCYIKDEQGNSEMIVLVYRIVDDSEYFADNGELALDKGQVVCWMPLPKEPE